jgi:stage V sporulation protein G
MTKKKIVGTVTVNDTNRTFETVVTSVQVFPFKDSVVRLGHIKGLATVVLNDAFMIRGLRIMESANGMFVAYPIDPFYKGEDLRSVVCPLSRELREHIENCVLEKYQSSI